MTSLATPAEGSRTSGEAAPAEAARAAPGRRVRAAELVFAAVPPFALNRLRGAALRACGVKLGRHSAFWGMPRLFGPPGSASRLRIGDDCGFNDACRFDLDEAIHLGDHVSVGQQVSFLTAGLATDFGYRASGAPRPARIVVEDGAWLGARSVLLGGVTVGRGAVVGAGVVVSSDVPPNMMLTGAQRISLAKWR